VPYINDLVSASPIAQWGAFYIKCYTLYIRGKLSPFVVFNSSISTYLPKQVARLAPPPLNAPRFLNNNSRHVFTIDNSSHLFVSIAYFKDKPVHVLWDTGSCCSIIKRSLLSYEDELIPYKPKVYGATGAQLSISGQTEQTLQFRTPPKQEHNFKYTFRVVSEATFPSFFDFILGINFIRKFQVFLNFMKYYVQINNLRIPLICEPESIISFPLWCQKNITGTPRLTLTSYSDSYVSTSPQEETSPAPPVVKEHRLYNLTKRKLSVNNRITSHRTTLFSARILSKKST